MMVNMLTVLALIWLVTCSYCSPVKRSTSGQQATDCYGTQCEVDLDIPQTVAIHFPENLSQTIVTVLPNIEVSQNKTVALLENMTTAFGTAILKHGQQMQILPGIEEFLQRQQEKQDQVVKLLENQQQNQNESMTLIHAMASSQIQTVSTLNQNHNESISLLHAMANSQIQTVSTLNQMANTLNEVVGLLQIQTQQLENTTANVVSKLNEQNQILLQQALPPRDCSDIAAKGAYSSGSYLITPTDGLGFFRVYCDMDTMGGPWTVFQKRFDGSEDFYLGWDAYEEGFGSIEGEHWLGLQKIRRLTRNGTWILHTELEDFEGNAVYADYESFSVGDAESYYRLSIGAYTGNAGDAMTYNNNYAFSTKDSDHDSRSDSCAEERQGAWWYHECTYANLNGKYLGPSQDSNTGLSWHQWKNNREVLKRSEMKMRRVQ